MIFVHMASVWVPFTSESKEAIADYDEIRKEIKLAIQECGRKLMTYVRKRQKIAREQARRGVFEKYVGEVVSAVSKISGLADKKQKDLYEAMMETAKKRTFQADVELDEDGNRITAEAKAQRAGKLDGDENVVIIETARTGTADEAGGATDGPGEAPAAEAAVSNGENPVPESDAA